MTVRVGSGSLLAGEALVTKDVASNSTVGGSPAKLLKTDIFWLRPSVHAFLDEHTKNGKNIIKILIFMRIKILTYLTN